MRFLADADLNRRIVTGLRRAEPEVEFFSANSADLEGLPDEEVLRIAAGRDCVLVSHDRRTMAAAFYTFIQVRNSPGLILLKQDCSIGSAIEELRLCWRALNATELINRIVYLPLL